MTRHGKIQKPHFKNNIIDKKKEMHITWFEKKPIQNIDSIRIAVRPRFPIGGFNELRV